MENVIELEVWKDIPEYEGLYQVSNLGRVRSVDREVLCRGGKTRISLGKILKQGKDTNSRLIVGLSKNGKIKTKRSYNLVALAFIGERPEGYQVCHIDGDVTNNKLSNLRYDTRSQNEIDRYKQGRQHGKLSTDEVLEIRRLYATGEYTKVKLGKMFKVKDTTIYRIINHQTFSWLNDDGTIDESKTSVS